MNPRSVHVRGFTLVELAIAVLVLGLLLGSLLVPLGTQVDQRNAVTTQGQLEVVKEALLGYAIAKGHLPCPDTDGDGAENARTPSDDPGWGCAGNTLKGWVPWATLAIGDTDAWGHRYYYRVSNEYTRADGDPSATSLSCGPSGSDPNECTLQLVDAGTLSVLTRGAASKDPPVPLASQVPAVVFSVGPNGYGGTPREGPARPAPPASNDDEETNLAAATTSFISRSRSPERPGCSDSAAGQPFCEFDDLVTWVSPGVLFNRLVAAGRLP